MTEETRPEETQSSASNPAGPEAASGAGSEAATGVASPPEAAPETGPEGADAAAAPEAPAEEKKPGKLHQTVEIKDAGACRKHVKVAIAAEDIKARRHEKFSELVSDANVAGFRPGKAPRKIIERRYQKDVDNQVRSEVLIASLEQL